MESDEFWQIIEQASKQVGFPRLGDCDAETYLDALYDKIVLLTPARNCVDGDAQPKHLVCVHKYR